MRKDQCGRRMRHRVLRARTASSLSFEACPSVSCLSQSDGRSALNRKSAITSLTFPVVVVRRQQAKPPWQCLNHFGRYTHESERTQARHVSAAKTAFCLFRGGSRPEARVERPFRKVRRGQSAAQPLYPTSSKAPFWLPTSTQQLQPRSPDRQQGSQLPPILSPYSPHSPKPFDGRQSTKWPD